VIFLILLIIKKKVKLEKKSNYNKLDTLNFFFNFKMNKLFDVVKNSLSLKIYSWWIKYNIYKFYLIYFLLLKIII